jgi:hypothetical protein
MMGEQQIRQLRLNKLKELQKARKDAAAYRIRDPLIKRAHEREATRINGEINLLGRILEG